jgi:hypothetical protein
MKTFLYLCTRYMYVHIFGKGGMVRERRWFGKMLCWSNVQNGHKEDWMEETRFRLI